MRTESEIRKQVELRFRRWALLLLNGGAWIVIGAGLYLYSRYVGVPVGWLDSVVLVLMLWGGLVGLHLMRTVYVELREWLVRRAIERERAFYRMRDTYEKRKHSEALPNLTEDGELIDYPDWQDAEVKAKYE